VDGLLATQSEGVGLIVCAISFQDVQPHNPPTSQIDRRTDRQTDGRHAMAINTALCVMYSASRDKNETSGHLDEHASVTLAHQNIYTYLNILYGFNHNSNNPVSENQFKICD